MKEKLNHFKARINSDNKNINFTKENKENKIKVKRPIKISSESNNSNVLIPSLNIKSKNDYNDYNVNSLKEDLAISRPRRYYKKRNIGNNINSSSLQNNIREGDNMIEKPKIKVIVKKKKNSKIDVVSSYKHKIALNSNLNKLNQFEQNDKSLIFNNSCLDNMKKPYKRNRPSLSLIQNSFDSTDMILKNNNLSYLANCNETSYDKKLRILTNTIENLINIRNSIKNEYYEKENSKIINTKQIFVDNKRINKYTDIKNKNYFSEKYSQNRLKKNKNRYEIFNLLNLKLNNIDNTISSNEEFNPMAPASLTQKNINHSSSTKAFNNDIPIFSKSIGRNQKNDYNYSALYSSPNDFLKTTYQKKLVKTNSLKKSDKQVIHKTSNLENLITKEDCINNSYINYMNKINNSFHHYNNSSYKILSQSNSCKKPNVLDNRLVEIEKKYNKNYSNLNNTDNKYYDRFSNSNLITNYNKEKDETKYTSEQVSDNNYSTTTSFYYNRNNNSILNNYKRVPSNNSELHLKNIITSIDYRNSYTNVNKAYNKFNNNNKNIVLYELDKNGKLNYKVKEMTNSMEKILRDASNSRSKKRIIKVTPKIEQEQLNNIYVKKNQGTVLRKNIDKKNNKYYGISSISNIKNKKKY